MIVRVALKGLLPLACAWARKQETRILRLGVPLNPDQLRDAQRLGILHPDRVRLHAVNTVPMPLHPVLRQAAEKTGLISPATIGMTLRYGIFLKSDFCADRRLIVHELAHTAQYERFGGFNAFLAQYLEECLTIGYPFGPLENEAKSLTQTICGDC